MITQGEICVILNQINESQKGQVNLESRIMQELIAKKIIAMIEEKKFVYRNAGMAYDPVKDIVYFNDAQYQRR